MNLDTVHAFLTKLCVNNNREWFAANKDWYDEAKSQMEAFSESLIAIIGKWDTAVAGLLAKGTVFRIYRDSRFSHDKTPYKNNIGCFIAPGGKSAGKAGYYVHIEPDNCFIGGGIYMPQPQDLLKIRTDIFNNPHVFSSIVNAEDFAANYTLNDDGKLKTAPKGFSKDFEYIDYLRFKHYAVGLKISDEQAVADDFLEFAADKCKIIVPFNIYLNSLLG